jgi:hypothetical protein
MDRPPELVRFAGRLREITQHHANWQGCIRWDESVIDRKIADTLWPWWDALWACHRLFDQNEEEVMDSEFFKWTRRQVRGAINGLLIEPEEPSK